MDKALLDTKIADMLWMCEMTGLPFFGRGEDGLLTEDTAITFSVAAVNSGFVSWNDPRNECLVVSDFITVSRTQTDAVSSAHR
jgi:hypothetical protein